MDAQEPIRIDRLSALATYGHTLAVHCWRCQRWADLDLPAVIARYGDREIGRINTRCSACGEPGALQVRPPMPTFTDYPRW